MRRKFRVSLLEELAAIEGKHKQLDGIAQSLDATRETTRSSRQARQVMPQLRIVRFHGIGITLAFRDRVPAWVIHQQLVHLPLITEVLPCPSALVNHWLHHLRLSLPDHLPAHNASRLTIHRRQDVGFVFFSPMKVNSSSNSSVSFSAGCGVSGRLAACALIQLATLCALMRIPMKSSSESGLCRPVRSEATLVETL